jgi:hypothetical protein
MRRTRGWALRPGWAPRVRNSNAAGLIATRGKTSRRDSPPSIRAPVHQPTDPRPPKRRHLPQPAVGDSRGASRGSFGGRGFGPSEDGGEACRDAFYRDGSPTLEKPVAGGHGR